MQDGARAQRDQPGRLSFGARVSRLARRRSVQVVTGAALLAAAATYLAVAAPSAAQQPAAEDGHAGTPPAAVPTSSAGAATKEAAPQADGSGTTHIDASLSQHSNQTSSTLTINGHSTTVHHNESITKHVVSDDGSTSIDISSTSSAGGSGDSSNETSLTVQIDGMSESGGSTN